MYSQHDSTRFSFSRPHAYSLSLVAVRFELSTLHLACEYIVQPAPTGLRHLQVTIKPIAFLIKLCWIRTELLEFDCLGDPVTRDP